MKTNCFRADSSIGWTFGNQSCHTIVFLVSLYYPSISFSISIFVSERINMALYPFDRATWPFLKIDMRHGAYQHGKKYNQHDIGLSLNSTCDIRPF